VNTIIVFHAERFGLSSLYQVYLLYYTQFTCVTSASTNVPILTPEELRYQLRGRVGRGARQAYALFTYPPGRELTPESLQRLEALQEFGVLGSGSSVCLLYWYKRVQILTKQHAQQVPARTMRSRDTPELKLLVCEALSY